MHIWQKGRCNFQRRCPLKFLFCFILFYNFPLSVSHEVGLGFPNPFCELHIIVTLWLGKSEESTYNIIHSYKHFGMKMAGQKFPIVGKTGTGAVVSLTFQILLDQGVYVYDSRYRSAPRPSFRGGGFCKNVGGSRLINQEGPRTERPEERPLLTSCEGRGRSEGD